MRVPIPVAVAILLNGRRVFMIRRDRSRVLPNQWEFPGGKIEAGEPPEDALRRELLEELGLRVGRLRFFSACSAVYDFKDGPVHYVLLAYRASPRDGPWSRGGRWMDARALKSEPIVEGSRPLVSELIRHGLVDATGSGRTASRRGGKRARP